MSTTVKVKTRVRELRKSRGWTLETLAEKSGVSPSQISHIERGTKGWTSDSLIAIAEALGTTVDKLFDIADAWQDVPIFGVIKGEGGVITKCQDPGKRRKRARIPAAFGEVLAVAVVGNGLYPRYVDGDLIFTAKRSSPIDSCIGRECAVWLEDGENLLRTVQLGTRPGHYNLITHIAPPLFDQSIVYCHPVVHTSREPF